MVELIADGSTLEKLYTGTEWAEGPTWVAEARVVRWSDIPNNRILEYSPDTGETRVHRDEVEYTNGRTVDLDGHVVQCSHGRRAVEREVDGVPTTLVDSYAGRRLNSPNDVVVAADGTIWFSDPPYGIAPEGREGHPGEQEYGGCFVFRFDESTGDLSPVITDMERPNGLAFSPDGSLLYVSDTGEHDGPGGHPQIRVYTVVDGGVRHGREFATVEPGASDGFRVDVEGRLWTSAGEALVVLSPDGEELLRLPVPETVSNVCFGGDDGHDLYLTASSSLYRIRTTTTQAPRLAR